MTKGRDQAARRMAAILSRHFLVLAVALFGALHVGAERFAMHNGPIAAVETVFAPAILTAQNHLIRASLPEDATPQATAPTQEIPTPPHRLARVSWEHSVTVSTPAITFLPPARGPPAV
jgi:hypothetical protein